MTEYDAILWFDRLWQQVPGLPAGDYDALTWFGKVEAGGLIPAGGFLMLALFVPGLSGVAVYLKAASEEPRLQAAKERYQIEEDPYFRAFVAQKRPSVVAQTIIPIAVMSLVNAYFAALMIYTPIVLRPPSTMANFLLLGSNYGVPRTLETDYYMLQTFDTMCWAYLGWYVWTVATIFARITTMELVAATYYSLLIRLTVAIFVAVVFRHLFAFISNTAPEIPLTAFRAEMVGFAAGLFPESVLQWMTRKLRLWLLSDAGGTSELSLDLIQGISPYRRLRLYEIGFDNCTNLAAANPVTLYLSSNLSLIEVIDWIAQAQLLILVGPEKFALLQANGYRTAIDLKRGAGSLAVGRLAELLGFSQAQLEDLCDGLAQDPCFTGIAALHARIK